MIYWYSAEGNSRYIARQLAEILGEKTADVSGLTGKEIRCHENVVGFVFPVHCWGVPPVMRDFIGRLQVGGQPYVWAVMTCGDDVGMADAMLRRILRKRGMRLSAVFSLRMPNTYLLMKGFRLDPEHLAREKVERAVQALPAIAGDIRGKAVRTDVCRGLFPRCKTYLAYPWFFHRKIRSGWWRADAAKCTRCGRCATLCPSGNIRLAENGLPQWSAKCVQCLACYHHCPVRAIDCFPYTAGCGQYTFKG